jgi:hypothetical protein
MSRVRDTAMLGGMMTYYRAWENRRFVRSLLREKQPEFADVLESAVREAPCLQCDGSRCSGWPGHRGEAACRRFLVTTGTGLPSAASKCHS